VRKDHAAIGATDGRIAQLESELQRRAAEWSEKLAQLGSGVDAKVAAAAEAAEAAAQAHAQAAVAASGGELSAQLERVEVCRRACVCAMWLQSVWQQSVCAQT
jgi:DNA repair exonuclease SbcCD ATPase subunit